MARELSAKEKKILYYNRASILDELSELQADFEDFTDEQLIEHRDVMAQRINTCLGLMLETAEDNIEEMGLKTKYIRSLDYDINEKIKEFLEENDLPCNTECIDYIRDNWIEEHSEQIKEHLKKDGDECEIDPEDVKIYWKEFTKQTFGSMEML